MGEAITSPSIKGLQAVLKALELAKGKGSASIKKMRAQVAETVAGVISTTPWEKEGDTAHVEQVFAQHTGDGYSLKVSYRVDSQITVVSLEEFLEEFTPCKNLSIT